MKQKPEILVLAQIELESATQRVRNVLSELVDITTEWFYDKDVELTVLDVAASQPVDTSCVTAYDGVICMGGGDVAGEFAGHTGVVPNEFGKDPRSDERQLAMLKNAVKADIPTLGICRGSQLLNVTLGGTLIPDLGDEGGHRNLGEGQFFSDEIVRVLPETKLADIVGEGELKVRGSHHQAVKQLAAPLIASARAKDGVIEAIEHPRKKWIVGLQWHPEDLYASVEDRDKIFGAFLRAVQQSAIEE